MQMTKNTEIMFQRSNGLRIFLNEACNNIRSVSADYLFYRRYTNDLEATLQQANQKMYDANQNARLLSDLVDRMESEDD